jgi:hypothetical protein
LVGLASLLLIAFARWPASAVVPPPPALSAATEPAPSPSVASAPAAGAASEAAFAPVRESPQRRSVQLLEGGIGAPLALRRLRVDGELATTTIDGRLELPLADVAIGPDVDRDGAWFDPFVAPRDAANELDVPCYGWLQVGSAAVAPRVDVEVHIVDVESVPPGEIQAWLAADAGDAATMPASFAAAAVRGRPGERFRLRSGRTWFVGAFGKAPAVLQPGHHSLVGTWYEVDGRRQFIAGSNRRGGVRISSGLAVFPAVVTDVPLRIDGLGTIAVHFDALAADAAARVQWFRRAKPDEGGASDAWRIVETFTGTVARAGEPLVRRDLPHGAYRVTASLATATGIDVVAWQCDVGETPVDLLQSRYLGRHELEVRGREPGRRRALVALSALQLPGVSAAEADLVLLGDVDVEGDFVIRGLPCTSGELMLLERDATGGSEGPFHRDFDLRRSSFVSL